MKKIITISLSILFFYISNADYKAIIKNNTNIQYNIKEPTSVTPPSVNYNSNLQTTINNLGFEQSFDFSWTSGDPTFKNTSIDSFVIVTSVFDESIVSINFRTNSAIDNPPDHLYVKYKSLSASDPMHIELSKSTDSHYVFSKIESNPSGTSAQNTFLNSPDDYLYFDETK